MTKHDTVGLIYVKMSYFLLLTPPPPLCTPSSIASSLGLRFATSEETITMLLSTPMDLK